MNSTVRVVGVTLISFGIYYFINEGFFRITRDGLDGFIHQMAVSHLITYILVGIPLFVGALIIASKNGLLGALGLSKPIMPAVGLGLLFTLPMFIGYGFLFEFSSTLSFNRVMLGVVSAGFFEELYYRAFLFGMLYRYTKFGFVPSIILCALVFALGHLHQSQDIGVLIGVFITTFMGAVFFAWLYCEWRFNIWVPIFMHMFMNLAWMLFDVAGNAFGGQGANIFRFATIGLAIVFTLRYKKRKGEALEVTRSTLWLKANKLPGPELTAPELSKT